MVMAVDSPRVKATVKLSLTVRPLRATELLPVATVERCEIMSWPVRAGLISRAVAVAPPMASPPNCTQAIGEVEAGLIIRLVLAPRSEAARLVSSPSSTRRVPALAS